MIETVAGRYGAVELVRAEQEDLYSDGYMSFDEMDGLSDSQSTHPPHSRPTTPSESSANPSAHISSKLRTRSSSAESENSRPHFAVPTKAVHILGLVPGTLPHALACLESARDEARRLTDIAPHSSNALSSSIAHTPEPVTPAKMGGGRMDRARKALSMAMPSNGSVSRTFGGGSVPAVIMSLGGAEEERNRERRRKVADGVLHWQKEVQRLRDAEEVQQRQMGTAGGVSRTGTKKGRR